MNSKGPGQIWEAALGELQLQVNRASFNTFLKGTKGVHLTHEVFTIHVEKAFAAEWLEKRMRPLIEKTIAGILQQQVEVRFKVGTEESLPEPAATELTSPNIKEPIAAPQPSNRWGKLNPNFNFDNFVVGSSNRLAHAAAYAVADNPGKSFNPLYIYSAPGLGKTHLLHAIGHAVTAKGLNALYVSMEQYVNDYVTSIREHAPAAFRDKYRNVDVLLIDDIQFLSGKDSTQEQFFHTFNHLHNESRQIVLTCDRAPTSITFLQLEDRLVSRFQGGLTADIQRPDIETRLAILHNKAKKLGCSVNEDLLVIMAKPSSKNIRELEGTLNKVVAISQLTKRPINLDLISEVMASDHSQPQQNINPGAIIDAVARYFTLDKLDLSGSSRVKELVSARHIAMYLIRQETNKSLSEIGQLLGNRNANTISHGLQKIEELMKSDQGFRRTVLEIRDLSSSKRSLSA
ncbi:MAG: chromosomal replication initiator protein DnaA [Dehalococcoidia bacterium]|nr:chromosomal replication initiator protein DnaA [Dehalococcoidia bacterium]